MTECNAPFAMIVEDQPMLMMEICDILEQAGFRTLEVDTGDQAIGVLEQSGGQTTLLFTDVEMPGTVDGFALARHAATHYPGIEIVVCSGRVSPKAGDMPAKATFIAKPFTVTTVHDHLREKLPDGKKPEPLKG